jgi:ABC-type cobalamin/Fe3+-siderophores transport system ATPase subunit
MLKVNNLNISDNKRVIIKKANFEIRLNNFYGAIGRDFQEVFEAILNFREIVQGTVLLSHELFKTKKVNYNNKRHIANIRKVVGYISHEDFFLNFGTVLNHLKWFGNINEVIDIAVELGLGDLITKQPKTLTDKEKIYFKLALALVKKPSILLINEPLKYLTIEEMGEFIRTVKKQTNHRNETIGVVILSESIFEYKEEFDKILKLESGVFSDD